MSNNRLPVIVTDLDGTLLDHHSYSYEAARPALDHIARQQYPLVLNSSKTRLEMLALQQELDLKQPFICENGAAIFLPEENGWLRQEFAAPRMQWLADIQDYRQQHSLPFAGFSDWSPEEIADITGLNVEKAERAAAREYTEPLLWEGSEQERLEFERWLAKRQMQLVKGGRFYSMQGQFNKAQAMQWLRQHYEQDKPVVTIALGDSPNDLSMLNAADIAVIIQSEQAATMVVDGPEWIIRTNAAGPAGWQEAMGSILKKLES